MFNPMGGGPYDPNNPTWGVWVEELQQAGVDFVCPNCTGSWPNTNNPPSQIAPMVAAVNARGLSNQLKFGCFDDNAASWCAQYNQSIGRGYGYATPMDLSDTNNWKFIYDYNYKVFFQTVPDANRFKINGRPPICIWSSSPLFITNAQGNLSRAFNYVRQRCLADFGFNPLIICDTATTQRDTTCANPGVLDGMQGWFIAGPSGPSHTLATWNGLSTGVACAEFQHPGQSGYLDPNHGQLFETGLNQTVNSNALITICEGFTDYEEDAAMWRTRNLDTSGNVLNYTNTLYDFPNQRINILRKHSNWPFPPELKLEAEGCDYFGGAAGGNGKLNYYRNGNIAIEPTTDIGGGYDVGWTQSGEWLEWENVPIQGSLIHFQVRVATPNSGCQLHFVIDGNNYPVMAVPNTGGYQTWTTVDSGTTYSFAKGSTHTVRLVCDTAGFNINYWQYHDDLPISTNLRFQSQANNKWVSAGSGTLNANANFPGSNETFAPVDAGAGRGYGFLALKALANGQYVTADTNGLLPLMANAATIGPSQIFQWTDNSDGTITLRALANSKLVSATNNPSSFPLISSRVRDAAASETFVVNLVSSNSLSFAAQPNDAVEGTPITAGALGEVQVQASDGSGNPISGVSVTISLSSGTGTTTGNTATTDTNGIAHFTKLQIDKVGSKTLLASNPSLEPSASASFNITLGAPAALTVESAADGSGSVLPSGNVTVGSSIIVFAIIRDSGGNFIENAPATWSLVNVSGGVAPGDLVPAAGGRSAVFTGHVPGSALIQAVASFIGQSGVQSVTPSTPVFSSGAFTDSSVLALAGTPLQELYGVSMGGGTARTTANGYTFSSYPSANLTYGGSGAYGLAAFLGGGGTSGDANFDAVLNYAELGINNGVLTLNNLTPGTRYSALFLAADTRSGVGTRSFTITSRGTSSPAQSYAYVGGSPYLGGYILCTFVATATTQIFTNTQGAYGYQLDGVLVGKTPVNTPAVIALDYNGSGVMLSGQYGPAGGMYRILSSTSLVTPLASWSPVISKYFDSSGAFSNVIPVHPAEPARFYRLTQP